MQVATHLPHESLPVLVSAHKLHVIWKIMHIRGPMFLPFWTDGNPVPAFPQIGLALKKKQHKNTTTHILHLLVLVGVKDKPKGNHPSPLLGWFFKTSQKEKNTTHSSIHFLLVRFKEKPGQDTTRSKENPAPQNTYEPKACLFFSKFA